MGIITQEGLPENCDSAYISIYICASFLACLSSSLPGEEEDQSPAMLMMNVPAKLFVLACLFVIISARRKGSEPCNANDECTCAAVCASLPVCHHLCQEKGIRALQDKCGYLKLFPYRRRQ